MSSVTLRLGLSGPDPDAIFGILAASGLAGNGPPESLLVDDRSRKLRSDWASAAVAGARRSVAAEWDGEMGRLSLQKGRIVKLTRYDYDLDPNRLLSLLAEIPFTLASAAELYPEWTDGSLGEVYQGPGFADLHWPHGWCCLFRGAGHERLVSRRWLDFGPWKLRRGANDTTMVQFHDLAADPGTALAQARLGHERMGIGPTGGFIQSDFIYASDLSGLYYAGQRKLHVAVHGREVGQREMLDACAARVYQRLGPEKPLDNVVYVFMEEDPAIAHLHELWLRGLECRAVIEGDERDLGADYRPQPISIEWARG